MRHRLVLAAAAVALVLLALPAAAPPAGAASGRPRLVVLIVVDMLRADLLTRYEDLFLPARTPEGVGGFRWMMEEGAWFGDARHDHYPLHTAVGHAAIVTGAYPYQHGVVSNKWYDRSIGRVRLAEEDPNSPVIGAAESKRGVSPVALRASTIGDEMKIAAGTRAKVWAVAQKDRAAVLMAGRLGDGAVWFDDTGGSWVTSRFYARGGALPSWLEAWNARRAPDALFGKVWSLSLPAEAVARSRAPSADGADNLRSLGPAFPHTLDGGLDRPGRAFYRAFAASPFGNAMTLDTSRRLAEAESLGQDAGADLLAIGLSALDYAGEDFGPNSPEILDLMVQTDRQLSGFFNDLARSIPGGFRSVTVVLTGDHGIAPIVAEAKAAGLPAGVFQEETVLKAIEEALDGELGADDWTEAAVEMNLYLNLRTIARRKVPQDEVEAKAVAAADRVDGIYAACARSRILSGRLPATDLARRVAEGFHPRVSGEIVLVPQAFWVRGQSERGAAHGAPYAYDTAVPILLAGAGVRPGQHLERVTTLDIAPTIAALLGVLPPSGSEGKVLAAALLLE